jgi:hypothetical protein
MDERVIRTYVHNNLMKKISEKNITTRSSMLISVMMISSGLMLFSFNLNTIMAVPADIVERGGGDYIYGRAVGIVENENGEPLWIIGGTFKSNLITSNQTQPGTNSTVYNANLEMIKPDGTAKHTHTLTNFVLTDITNQNNATLFNGTGTISMPDTFFTDVPISIKIMNNKNLGIINIDPTKVDNHFGNKPIYGLPLEDSENKERKHGENKQYKNRS